MKRIVDHIEYSKHRVKLKDKGVHSIKEFKEYLKSKGWFEGVNYWFKK